jgi:hypothetical protein
VKIRIRRQSQRDGSWCRSSTHIHQAKARHGLFSVLAPSHRECASGAAGVDEELVHVLESVEPVGAASPAEHVHIELVRLGQEQVGFGGDEGEAFEEADAQGAVGDDLCQGETGGLDIVAALDDLQVGRNGAQVFVRMAVGKVSEAEGLTNLAGREQLLELWRWKEVSCGRIVSRRRGGRGGPLRGCRGRDPGYGGLR